MRYCQLQRIVVFALTLLLGPAGAMAQSPVTAVAPKPLAYKAICIVIDLSTDNPQWLAQKNIDLQLGAPALQIYSGPSVSYEIHFIQRTKLDNRYEINLHGVNKTTGDYHTAAAASFESEPTISSLEFVSSNPALSVGCDIRKISR